ncbi:MAG: hypothetical protein Q7J77_10355 [Undibacterium sp.]|nr:hypothetical protein [Undibacterium sp.]
MQCSSRRGIFSQHMPPARPIDAGSGPARPLARMGIACWRGVFFRLRKRRFIPFALSLSKGLSLGIKDFDKLRANGFE